VDINKGVALLKEGLEMSPKTFSIQVNVGSSLRSRFDRLGDTGDISEAIPLFKQALTDLPRTDPNRAHRLQNPGNALAIRFRRSGDLGDINESVLMFEEAISLYPPGHPAKAICLSNFGFLPPISL
jgi:tetratricopeptide (TPR) repeat protein